MTQDQVKCSGPILQNIVDKTHEKLGDKIINYRLIKGENEFHLFELKTGDHNETSQLVNIFILPPIQDLFEHRSIVVMSKIGNLDFVDDKEDLIQLIKMISRLHLLNLHINDDDKAELVFGAPLETTNVSMVADVIELVANYAEKIESIMVGSDNY